MKFPPQPPGRPQQPQQPVPPHVQPPPPAPPPHQPPPQQPPPPAAHGQPPHRATAPTFKNPKRRWATPVYAALSGLLLFLLVFTALAGLEPVVTAVLVVMQVFLLATILFQMYLAHGYVRLTPEGIVVREVGTRTLPWREIAEIRVKPFLANTVVQVRMAGGRKRNLVAPVQTGDGARFRDEVALIHQWWAYCRGW